jgi:hypothetical protein
MELDQNNPEAIEDEPIIPGGEQGDGGDSSIADTPSDEPVSRHDDGAAERLRSVEAQARYFQEEAERHRRELEAIRASHRPDPREEQARLEAMDPEQRISYLFERRARESDERVAAVTASTTAQIDQLKFDSELNHTASQLGWSNAQKAKYASEIEAQYNNYARQNMTIPRGALLRHKLGDEMINSGAKAIKGAADKGRANIARQTSRMTPASSNTTGKPTGKTKAQESMERLLQAGVLEM